LQREAARLDFEQVAGGGFARFRRRRLSHPRLRHKRRARQKGRREEERYRPGTLMP
jgi:hypothetical protein